MTKYLAPNDDDDEVELLERHNPINDRRILLKGAVENKSVTRMQSGINEF